ncbi:MAG: carbamoyl phosphate synthase small subunit [Oscillospiraceae bacterium]|nr:carbamoyl phosphate synthase small subunit [Oscillospiraceae bacterium]
MKATLILENGSVFTGTSIGCTEDKVCQLVFNTSMVGYQELLTDPSCAGQGIVMSYPLVGNYGVNEEDCQSSRVWAEAIVVRRLSDRGSNFRCQGDLNTYLKQNNVTGIQGVDTRALTKILRNEGSMNAMLTCAEHFNVSEVMEKIKAYKVAGKVEQVSRSQPESFEAQGDSRCHAAVLDFGVTNSLVAHMLSRGCKVTVLPANTGAQDVLDGGYDGVLLSGGPGDPAENEQIIGQIKALYESDLPLFGIGLGHQMLAIAAGAKTVALPYGHRGGNIPVRDVEKGKIYITSQNHGYVVDKDSVDCAVAQVSHINVNDGSVEGLKYSRPNCFSVQYDPEGNKGPVETEYLFDRMVAIMGGDK